MAAVRTHENANIQTVLNVLITRGLGCKEVVAREDDVGGLAVIVDGSHELEVCKTRFSVVVRILDQQTDRTSIRDTMFDRAFYDSVQIFRIGGEVISLCLAK